MALRLLKSALPRSPLTVVDAITIMKYHLARNETAQRSHAKRWKKKHKRTTFKLLL